MVDACPGFSEAAGGAVGLVDDDEVPGRQVVVSVGVDDGGEGGVGGVDGDRAGEWGEFGELGGFRGHGEVAGGGVFHGLAGGADGHRWGFVAGCLPGADGLGEQVQGRDEDQDPPAGRDTCGGAGGDEGFPGPAGRDDAGPGWVRRVLTAAVTASFWWGGAGCRRGSWGVPLPGVGWGGVRWHCCTAPRGSFGCFGDDGEGGAGGGFAYVEAVGDAAA